MSRSKKDQLAWEKYLKTVANIKKQTKPKKIETSEAKEERIKRLLGNFELFCKYYFARYMDCDFAYFHKEFANYVIDNEDCYAIAEWPREHAKSVLIDIFIVMFLKATKELTGLLLGSATYDKAKGLLSDLQAELEGNQLYIEDFGEQVSFGNWQSGHFITKDGIGFWAFGRGQSPRGAREAHLRPNVGIIDDIDDKKIIKNIELVTEAVDWVNEDFLGALDTRASRLMVGGNRIGKHSILAHLVGDIDEEDPKREGIYHSKVYAIEDPKTHEKAGMDNGVPAWNRYTLLMLKRKFEKMGYTSSRREFFHEWIIAGLVFQYSWFKYGKVKNIEEYDSIVTYCDPSFRAHKKSDFKAIVTIGKTGKNYHLLWCWIRQASVHSMVIAFYDAFGIFGEFSTYWMEAVFLQEDLLNDFDQEADKREEQLPIRPDKRSKPDKSVRIENISPYFERGVFLIDEQLRKCKDTQILILQFMGFGGNGKDDGPDATEGAIHKLNKATRKSKFKPRMGKFKKGRRNRNR